MRCSAETEMIVVHDVTHGHAKSRIRADEFCDHIVTNVSSSRWACGCGLQIKSLQIAGILRA